MSDFQAEIEALYRAYASGALTVRFGNRQITYGSAEDLLRRIEHLEGKSKKRPIAGLASFSRGDR